MKTSWARSSASPPSWATPRTAAMMRAAQRRTKASQAPLSPSINAARSLPPAARSAAAMGLFYARASRDCPHHLWLPALSRPRRRPLARRCLGLGRLGLAKAQRRGEGLLRPVGERAVAFEEIRRHRMIGGDDRRAPGPGIGEGRHAGRLVGRAIDPIGLEIEHVPDDEGEDDFAAIEPVSAEHPAHRHRRPTAQEVDNMGEVLVPGGDFAHHSSLAKKSLPLSSTTTKAGKSTTSMRQIASMPSSGYSTTSTCLMQSCAKRAAGPPIEPK